MPVSKTLPNEPIPETVRDREPEPPPPKSRRSWLWILIACVLAAIAVAGGALYFGVWRYQATARRHVPAGSNIMIRADANEILLFGPVRTHLWPLALTRSGDEKNARIDAIRQKTGVSIPLDLREVIVASLDASSWVVLIGGNIEPGRFVAGLAEVLTEEGLTGWTLDGDILTHELGWTIAQADDGTIILGTNRDVTMAALPASEDAATAALSEPAALTFSITRTAYAGALGTLPLTLPGLDTLDKVAGLSGSLELTAEPTLRVVVEPDRVDAATLASELSGLQRQLKLATLVISHDLFGAKHAIAGASVKAEGNAVTIVAPWSYAALDRATKQLADAIASGRMP